MDSCPRLPFWLDVVECSPYFVRFSPVQFSVFVNVAKINLWSSNDWQGDIGCHCLRKQNKKGNMMIKKCHLPNRTPPRKADTSLRHTRLKWLSRWSQLNFTCFSVFAVLSLINENTSLKKIANASAECVPVRHQWIPYSVHVVSVLFRVFFSV